ncbi:Mut7-C ubiquitin/RNAse domain-containing protein [Desulfovibrio inopinatus]|uniref:Mut7-C ubiquitin/RNAse domain-containing protein n=1 Tax=Desulfovibrio inopinatus TaxID=102109 RepID=UPI000417BD66|nr:Mut7-C ubiquitin/RNAse domain-containing protein [Desulfovibrio inopinatus]
MKDVMESYGVPHTEVFGLLANLQPVGFNHIVVPHDRIVATPAVFPIHVEKSTRLRPALRGPVRFVVDANVGRLAGLLRMLGFDTSYSFEHDDAALAEISFQESRIVLTRDRGLLKRSAVIHGRLLRANDPWDQLGETVRAYGLTPPWALFSRCLRCNALLERTTKSHVIHRLLPKTKRYYNDFSLCPRCDALYWPGSHFDAMLERLQRYGLIERTKGTESFFIKNT